MIELNWWAIIVAALVNMALGALWYSKALFGKKWMELMGKKEEDIKNSKKDLWKMYGVTFVGSLVTSFILALFMQYKEASTFLEGAILGILGWIALVVPTNLSNVIFEGKNAKLFYISIGFYLASLVIMGGILAVWQ